MTSSVQDPAPSQRLVWVVGPLLAAGAAIGLLYGAAIQNVVIGLTIGLAAGSMTWLAALRRRGCENMAARSWLHIPVPAPLLGLGLLTLSAWLYRLFV